MNGWSSDDEPIKVGDFYRRAFPVLMAIGRRSGLGLTEDDLEDACQDTILYWWASLTKKQKQESLADYKPQLFLKYKHTLIDVWRKKKRRLALFEQVDLNAIPAPHADHDKESFRLRLFADLVQDFPERVGELANVFIETNGVVPDIAKRLKKTDGAIRMAIKRLGALYDVCGIGHFADVIQLVHPRSTLERSMILLRYAKNRMNDHTFWMRFMNGLETMKADMTRKCQESRELFTIMDHTVRMLEMDCYQFTASLYALSPEMQPQNIFNVWEAIKHSMNATIRGWNGMFRNQEGLGGRPAVYLPQVLAMLESRYTPLIPETPNSTDRITPG